MASNETQAPPKRGHKPKVPTDYLLAISDRIAKINPTKEITFNTMKEIWCDGFSRGVLWRIDGSKKFKDLQEQHFKQYWDRLQDFLDDVIHDKVQPKQQ